MGDMREYVVHLEDSSYSYQRKLQDLCFDQQGLSDKSKDPPKLRVSSEYAMKDVEYEF